MATQTADKTGFKPKAIVKKLLTALPERSRQIENHALAALKKSPAFASAEAAFQELERIIDGLGGIVCEDDLLNFMTKDKSMQNHIYFLLVLGDPFKYR